MSATPVASDVASGSESARAAGAIPGTLSQALLLSRYQLRDYLRARRFVLMMAIVGIIGAIISIVLAVYLYVERRPGPDR